MRSLSTSALGQPSDTMPTWAGEGVSLSWEAPYVDANGGFF
jgi:hypothetical protein